MDLPATPAELVQQEPSPLKRFKLVSTVAAAANWLPRAWVEQRDEDLRALLLGTPPVPQSDIARAVPLSRQRVCRLAARALGASRP